MIIVIDDERTFAWYGAGRGEIRYARNSAEGIVSIAKAWTNYALRFGDLIDLYLDHDLGENDTIMPVVDFLYVAANAEAKGSITGLSMFINNIYIHSQNPTAADTIVPLLSPLYKKVQRIPLPELV